MTGMIFFGLAMFIRSHGVILDLTDSEILPRICYIVLLDISIIQIQGERYSNQNYRNLSTRLSIKITPLHFLEASPVPPRHLYSPPQSAAP